MSLIEQLCNNYDSLLTGNNDLIQQATENLQIIYNDPSCIEALFGVLARNKSNHRQQAALALKRALKNHKGAIERKIIFFETLYEYAIVENDSTIQRNIVDSMVELIDSQSQEYLDITSLIIQNSSHALSNQNPNVLNTSLLLLSNLDLDELKNQKDFFEELIMKGLELSDPSPSIEFGFMYGSIMQYCEEEEEDISFYKNLWEQVIQMLLSPINSYFFDFLVANMSHQLEGGSPFADALVLFNSLFPYIGCNEVDPISQLQFSKLIDQCFEYEEVSDYIIENGILDNLVQRYFLLSSYLYVEEDTLALSNVDVFSSLSSHFVEFDEFISLLFDSVHELFENPQTRPAVILSLTHCFEHAIDNFIENLDDIVNLIVQALKDDSQLVRDSASFAIGSFASEFETYIDDYTDIFANSIIDSFENDGNQSSELIYSLTEVFNHSTDTDGIFERAYTFLMGLIGEADKSWQLTLFQCNVALCKSAKKMITSHFEEVFDMMAGIINNISDESTFLIGPSVESLAHIALNSREQFVNNAVSYGGILCNLLNAEDNDIIISTLKSIGHVAMDLPECFTENLSTICNRLLEIGSKDNDKDLAEDIIKFQQRQTELALTGETQFDIDVEDENENKDGFSQYSIPALALSALCAILLRYPDSFKLYWEQILNYIEIQASSHEADTIDVSCRAMSLFSEALTHAQIEYNTPCSMIVNYSLRIIDSSNTASSVASALTVLRSVISNCGISSINERQDDVLIRLMQFFNGQLPVQSNSEIHDIYEAVGLLIQEMIVGLHNHASEVFKKFIPVLLKLASHKQLAFREFALPILGYLVEEAGNTMEEYELETILSYSIAAAKKGMASGFYVINQFTTGSPDTLKPVMNEIITILKDKLQDKKKKGENYRLLLDRCVGCAGEIERNIMQDSFPYSDFHKICLESMPAKVDPSENHGMMRFFIQFCNVFNLNPPEIFLRPLIRVFSSPREELGEALTTSELYIQIKSILINLLNMVPNSNKIITEVCGSDEIRIQRLHNEISLQ